MQQNRGRHVLMFELGFSNIRRFSVEATATGTPWTEKDHSSVGTPSTRYSKGTHKFAHDIIRLREEAPPVHVTRAIGHSGLARQAVLVPDPPLSRFLEPSKA